MVHNVVYKKSVQRDLNKLPKAAVGRILDHIENQLTKKAQSTPVLKGQFAGLRKYRIGDHRVIYAIIGTDILVLRIAHRKDVYRRPFSPSR